MLIGLTVESDLAMTIIKEIVEEYGLTLYGKTPIIILPQDDQAMFFCETDDQETLDLLDIDELIDIVSYMPEIHKDFKTSVSGEQETVDRLNKLLTKDVELG